MTKAINKKAMKAGGALQVLRRKSSSLRLNFLSPINRIKRLVVPSLQLSPQ
jgi:hypothetical protein